MDIGPTDVVEDLKEEVEDLKKELDEANQLIAELRLANLGEDETWG